MGDASTVAAAIVTGMTVVAVGTVVQSTAVATNDRQTIALTVVVDVLGSCRCCQTSSSSTTQVTATAVVHTLTMRMVETAFATTGEGTNVVRKAVGFFL